jgi:transcriptional regulator with XRE-family HTH domain
MLDSVTVGNSCSAANRWPLEPEREQDILGGPRRKKPDPTDCHVGARVRMRRLTQGMSQTQLGNALGMTFQQIQKYEKGTNRISASRLQQIAETLQVAVPFFFDGIAKGPSSEMLIPDYTAAFLSSADGLALAKAFTKIADPHVRRAVVALVRATAGEE